MELIKIIDRLHNIYDSCDENLDDILNGIIAKEYFINRFMKFMKKYNISIDRFTN